MFPFDDVIMAHWNQILANLHLKTSRYWHILCNISLTPVPQSKHLILIMVWSAEIVYLKGLLIKAVCLSLRYIPFEMKDRVKYLLMFIALICIISSVDRWLNCFYTAPLQWCHINVVQSRIAGHSTVCLTAYASHVKETSKSALLAPFEGNSPVTGEFHAQRASNGEKASIWWRHHVKHKHNVGGERRISHGLRWNTLYLPVIRLDVGKPDIVRGDTDTLDSTIQTFIPRQSQVFPFLRHTRLINTTAVLSS